MSRFPSGTVGRETLSQLKESGVGGAESRGRLEQSVWTLAE